MEGKPLAFDQLSVELLALLPAPDRSGQPVARNRFEPHSASPFFPVPRPTVCALARRENRTLVSLVIQPDYVSATDETGAGSYVADLTK